LDLLEFNKVTKLYNKFKALDEVTFKVNSGEIVGFVGPNGAGKTTSIKIAAGILKPTKGDVLIDGLSVISKKVESSKRIGWVPEIPVFESDWKAIDYFKYLAGYHGISGKQAEILAKELLSQVNIWESSNKKLKDFSQGMKKRFALAVSMISNPQNYLFDEVLNGLDPEGIAFFREKAKEFKKSNCSVLFSSHILSEVEAIADKVVLINKGKILAIKTIDEIKSEAKIALRVVVENPDEKLIDVLSSFGKVNKINNNSFDLDTNANPSEVNAALVKLGYKVSEINKSGGLEEYFMRLTKGD